MEENNNKQTDAFLQKHIQEIPLESPSNDFTSNLMGILVEEETSTVTQYSPLISKKGWIGVGIVVLSSLALLFFGTFQKQGEKVLDKVSLDFSFLSKFNLSGTMEGFSMPSVMFFGALLFSISLLIQVLYIKGYINNKIAS